MAAAWTESSSDTGSCTARHACPGGSSRSPHPGRSLLGGKRKLWLVCVVRVGKAGQGGLGKESQDSWESVISSVKSKVIWEPSTFHAGSWDPCVALQTPVDECYPG